MKATPAFVFEFEHVVVAHLSVFAVGTAWSYGGMTPWAEALVRIWGTLGIVLFVIGLIRARRGPSAAFRHLWPVAFYDLLVLLGCLNPSLKTVVRDGVSYLQLTDPPYAWLPTSARPDLAIGQLWQLNAIVLSCYNAFLSIRSRRRLRVLLAVIAANALILAVLGTFQKLGGAKGLWFGLVETPQPYFFATFVYHNHWGAFTLLNVGACLALLFHSFQRGGDRDIWHSPVLVGAVAILLLAATAPLSGSRSSTVLLTVFLAGALIGFLALVVRRRRAERRPAAAAVASIVIAAVLAVAAIGYVAQDMIARRSILTAQQIERIRTEDAATARLTLYRDTWHMAAQRPWFGWGLGSYPDVFRVYNSQRTVERWFGQPYYRDAHSDWLQSLAETVGSPGTELEFAL